MTAKLIIPAVLGWLALGTGGAFADTDLQLRSFVAPVKPANPAAKKEAPITVRFSVATSETAFQVCELSPRLRDSLLETLYLNPIPVSAQNVMDVSKVEPLLLANANKALRQPLLTGIKVIPGVQEMNSSSSRSRSAALGCEVDDGKAKAKTPPPAKAPAH